MVSLQEAYNKTCRARWNHCRDGGAAIKSQAHTALLAVASVCPKRLETPVDEVAQAHVEHAVKEWYALGITPATINKRLSCLRTMGVAVAGYEKLPNKLKWWLRPDQQEAALKRLRKMADAYTYPDQSPHGILADFIEWTTLTGLRVEETLRLTPADFTGIGGHRLEVMVPGLKTATSQATLPVSLAASVIATRRLGGLHMTNGVLFPVNYRTLSDQWVWLRGVMKWEGNGVTLKALRRSAARHLHVDCGMPLDMVRHYLRHEDIETTLGYLRLTGGYGTEEMRRYFK